MSSIKQTAYLREFTSTEQCELTFTVNVKLDGYGLFQSEVRAVRKITDTVESMLQHIVKKVQKMLQPLKNDESIPDAQIPVGLINSVSRKSLQPQMVLKDLVNTVMMNLEFEIFHEKYIFVINAPLVKEIKLPVILYANNTVQPSKLHMLFTEHNLSQFTWFKSKDKENWIGIGNTFKYKIIDDDLDHYLKVVCVPCNNILTGPAVEVASENKVLKIGDLPVCPFEIRHKFAADKLTGNHFRLISYNVLAKRYSETNESFPYCTPESLAIDYRKQLIVKELLGYRADIICLQEVDRVVFTDYYRNIFKSEGYQVFYHRKGNRIPEGLAGFFAKSHFKTLDDRQIIYSSEIKTRHFHYLWNFVKANADLKDLFMKQMTSLEITVLKCNNHIVIVGNTHLFYRPDAELVRLLQVNIAATYLHTLMEYYYQRNNRKVTVIFCGDFNSVPTSPVFEYMTKGKISKTHPVFENTVNNVDLKHNFKFQSACGVPTYTNYTDDFRGCLDYIFVESNKVSITKVVPFPDNEELEAYEGLPNDVYPSDHLPLVVDLVLL